MTALIRDDPAIIGEHAGSYEIDGAAELFDAAQRGGHRLRRRLSDHLVSAFDVITSASSPRETVRRSLPVPDAACRSPRSVLTGRTFP
jgi:hypothetical protein